MTEREKYEKTTWILLGITWILCLIPFPGFGIIGLTVNVAAFIVAIIVIVKGEIIHGVIQLCSAILLTPIIYALGLAIFSTAIGYKSDDILAKYLIEQLNIAQKQRPLHVTKQVNTSPRRPTQQEIRRATELARRKRLAAIENSTYYVVETTDGGTIECKKISRDQDGFTMTTQAGMVMSIHDSRVKEITKYQSINGTIQKTKWNG